MNKNQKIALGCGGAGCLGLLVVFVAGVVLYTFTSRSSSGNANRNFNFNLNSNANRPSTANSNSDSSTDTTSSSSMSDDDKHKLFHAVGMTGDTALITRVLKKIGMVSDDGVPTSEYAQFTKDHFAWALKNTAFIQEMNTKEKAQAYVDEHLDD